MDRDSRPREKRDMSESARAESGSDAGVGGLRSLGGAGRPKAAAWTTTTVLDVDWTYGRQGG